MKKKILKKESIETWTLPMTLGQKDKDLFRLWAQNLKLYWNTLVSLIMCYNYLKKTTKPTPRKFKKLYYELYDFCQQEIICNEDEEIDYPIFIKAVVNKRQLKPKIKDKMSLLPISNNVIKIFLEKMIYKKENKEEEEEIRWRTVDFLGMSQVQTAIKDEFPEILKSLPNYCTEGVLKKCCTAFKKKENKFNKTVFPKPFFKLDKSKNISIPVKKKGSFQVLSLINGSKNKYLCQLFKKNNRKDYLGKKRDITATIKNTYIKNNHQMGEVTNLTIKYSEKNKKWEIAIGNRRIKEVEKAHKPAIGIDLGVKNAITTSDSQQFTLPEDKIKKLQARRKKQQKKISKAYDTNDQVLIKKFAKRIAKIDRKIVNIRKEFTNQTANKLSDHKEIVFENLNIKNMTKSAKGNLNKPGKNVKAKSGLNRAILEKNWGAIKAKTQEKAILKEALFLEIDPRFTSQICHKCGHKDKDNRKSQAEFKCIKCGHTNNADINAAQNILKIGKKYKKELVENDKKKTTDKKTKKDKVPKAA